MRWKRSNSRGSSAFGIPVPVSCTVSTALPPRVFKEDSDLAIEGEFKGVGEQIENDLLPHVAIDIDRLPQAQGSPLPASSRPSPSRIGNCWQIGSAVRAERSVGLKLAPVRPGFDAREIQEAIHASSTNRIPLRCATVMRSRSSTGRRSHVRQRLFERPEHQRRGVRNSWLTLEKKVVLARSSSASISARWRSCLVSGGVCDCRRDLARDKA